MTIDERIEALTMSVELLTREVETLRDTMTKLVTAAAGENIRALARIAEVHERRLTDLEGGPQ
jgi:archaellum component FlaC